MGAVSAGAILGDRYELVERRASGASATVWAAHDDFLRRYSALTLGNVHLVDEWVHEAADGNRYLVTHGDEYDVIILRNTLQKPAANEYFSPAPWKSAGLGGEPEEVVRKLGDAGMKRVFGEFDGHEFRRASM